MSALLRDFGVLELFFIQFLFNFHAMNFASENDLGCPFLRTSVGLNPGGVQEVAWNLAYTFDLRLV